MKNCSYFLTKKMLVLTNMVQTVTATNRYMQVLSPGVDGTLVVNKEH